MGTLSPSPWLLALDNTGVVIPSARWFFYDTGTTTKRNVYTDAALTVAHPNPLTVDAAGRAVVYLSPTAYKFVLAPAGSDDPPTSPIKTIDPVGAIPGTTVNLDISGVAGENLVAGRPVYLSDGLDGNTAGAWYEGDSTTSFQSTEPEVLAMPVANIGSGQTGSMRLLGRVTGLSGLTIGSTYYVGSGGGLEVVAVTNARKVGVADTATSLVMADKRVDSPVVIASSSTVTGNVGGGEDSLYAYVAGRSQLWKSHMAWVGSFSGITANNANVKTIRVRINDGTNNISLIDFRPTASEAGRWVLDFRVVRVSATSFISRAVAMVGPGNGPVSASGTGLLGSGAPGLCTFANDVTISVTGESAGAASNDIVTWGGQISITGILF